MEELAVINIPPPLPVGRTFDPKVLPVFVTAFLIADLVVCGLEIFCSIIYFIQLSSNEIKSFNFEITTGILSFLIVASGIGGDIMILSKKAYGIKIAYISIVLCICNLIVVICNGILGGWMDGFEQMDTDKMKLFFEWITLSVWIIFVMFNGTYLFFYWKAISKAKTFFSSQEQTKTAWKRCLLSSRRNLLF